MQPVLIEITKIPVGALHLLHWLLYIDIWRPPAPKPGGELK
jgi:hypothetical protein